MNHVIVPVERCSIHSMDGVAHRAKMATAYTMGRFAINLEICEDCAVNLAVAERLILKKYPTCRYFLRRVALLFSATLVGCGGAAFTNDGPDPKITPNEAAIVTGDGGGVAVDSMALAVDSGNNTGEVGPSPEASGVPDVRASQEAAVEAGLDSTPDAVTVVEAAAPVCCRTPTCGQVYWDVPFAGSPPESAYGFADPSVGGACGVVATPWGNCAGTIVAGGCP